MKKIYDVTVVCDNCGKMVYDHYTMDNIEIGGEFESCECLGDEDFIISHYEEAEILRKEDGIFEENYPNGLHIGDADLVHSGQIWIFPKSKIPALDWITMQGIAEITGKPFRTIQSDYNRGKFEHEEGKGFVRYSGGTRLFHIDAVKRIYRSGLSE